MEQLLALLGNIVQFVYTCWDRIVLNGYFERLQRPENLIYFFHDIALDQLCTALGLQRAA